MPGQLLTAVPVLVSNDFDRTVAFYADFGFHLCARYDQGYLIIRRDGAELHFKPAAHIKPEESWHMSYVRMLGVDALMKEWAETVDLPDKDIPRYAPARLQDWGMIEAHLVDPDGNLVIFGAGNEATGAGDAD